MATISGTTTTAGTAKDESVKKCTWTGLGQSDDGSPFAFAEWADRTVQVTGTFGSGGTVIMEGSNDGGTTYFQLLDPLGNSISYTAAGGDALLEAVELVRPRVTAGDGTTDLDVHLLARRPNNMRA